MFKKISPRTILLVLLVIFIVTCACGTTMGKKSMYTRQRDFAPVGGDTGPSPGLAAAPSSACEMKAGTGLASSLLPKEVASQEDFGQFAPEDILAGQNFLEPRNQIGFPESVGGALRNANQQVRAEPPNPKAPFVWNNSTIVPDTMMRPLV